MSKTAPGARSPVSGMMLPLWSARGFHAESYSSTVQPRREESRVMSKESVTACALVSERP